MMAMQLHTDESGRLYILGTDPKIHCAGAFESAVTISIILLLALSVGRSPSSISSGALVTAIDQRQGIDAGVDYSTARIHTK